MGSYQQAVLGYFVFRRRQRFLNLEQHIPKGMNVEQLLETIRPNTANR